ncbi:MAG: SMC-Scp complex subunit ScpB [Pirellulales bacterium]
MRARQPIPAAVQLRSVACRYSGRRPLRAVPHVVIRRRKHGIGSSPERSASRLARLEAALFVAREPLSTRRLAQLASLSDATEARTLVGELIRQLDRRNSSFIVERVAGGYQLLTRPKFAPWLRKIAPAAQEVRLSQPALETLAVVAYRQPVGRAEIEAIRGVQCGELLRQLMDRDLLRIVGRSDELGRPLLYGTTRRFLHMNGLGSLDDLPHAAKLRKDQTSRKLGVAE